MKLRILVLALLCCILLTNAIADDLEAPKVDLLSTLQYAEVTTDKGPLNMRMSPKSSGTVLKRIPNHTIVLVLKPDDKWSKVAYDGKEGYVISDYLSILDDLPYSTLEQGAHGKEVLSLKERLQELGYFRAGAIEMTDSFTETMAKRIMIFQQLNGLEQTGIATPELQAFIFWGNAAKNTAYLPPAPYYVSGSDGNTVVDPVTGLTAKISCKQIGRKLINNGGDMQFTISYTVSIKADESITYTTKVYLAHIDNDREIKSSPFTVVLPVGESIYKLPGAYLVLIVTDSNGNRVSTSAWCSFYGTEDEYEEPQGGDDEEE